jgi:hypothetical protein
MGKFKEAFMMMMIDRVGFYNFEVRIAARGCLSMVSSLELPDCSGA